VKRLAELLGPGVDIELTPGLHSFVSEGYDNMVKGIYYNKYVSHLKFYSTQAT
jgi:hypothetical protein